MKIGGKYYETNCMTSTINFHLDKSDSSSNCTCKVHNLILLNHKPLKAETYPPKPIWRLILGFRIELANCVFSICLLIAETYLATPCKPGFMMMIWEKINNSNKL